MPLGNFPDDAHAAHRPPEINWCFEYSAILAHPQIRLSFPSMTPDQGFWRYSPQRTQVLTYLRELLTTGVTGIQEKIDQMELSTAQPLQGLNTAQGWLNCG
jgi:hypothetical protein